MKKLFLIVAVFYLPATSLAWWKEVDKTKAGEIKKNFSSRGKQGEINKRIVVDGAIFSSSFRYAKPLQPVFALVRRTRGVAKRYEEIKEIRNFTEEREANPSKASREVIFIDMAAVNKNELYCLLREVKGGVPEQLSDGIWAAPEGVAQRYYVEKWDGKKWRQVGKGFPKRPFGEPRRIGASGDGSVFVLMPDGLLMLDKSAWKYSGIPFAQDRDFFAFSVLNKNSIWFLVAKSGRRDKGGPNPRKDRFVLFWNGKTFEEKGGRETFEDIWVSPDGAAFVLDTSGKIFQWVEGEQPPTFFQTIKNFFSDAFDWISRLFRF